MGMPEGAQISDDGDHYLHEGELIEIDHESAVAMAVGVGSAKWTGEDARLWREFFNAALQGTTAHSHMKPAAQVRLASDIADHSMHYHHRAGKGLHAAIEELKNDPNTSHELLTFLGTLSIGDNSTWLNAFNTSLGTFAQNSTDANGVARQTANVADEALKLDFQGYPQVWDAYNKHRVWD